jgi:hypothetical protein
MRPEHLKTSRPRAAGLVTLAVGLALAGSVAPAMAGPTVANTNSCAPIELLVVIAVHDSSGRLVQTVTTDRNGGFTLKDLKPGAYKFTLSGDSLTRAISKGGPEWGDRPGIIAILIGLLLPSGLVEPVSSDRFPLVPARSSGGGQGSGKVSVQDISFTRVLPAPKGLQASAPVNGWGGTGGGRFTFKGTVSLEFQGSTSLETR